MEHDINKDYHEEEDKPISDGLDEHDNHDDFEDDDDNDDDDDNNNAASDVSAASAVDDDEMRIPLVDWALMFQTKCYGCQFPIEPGDRWVEALNENWHSECFNCSVRQTDSQGVHPPWGNDMHFIPCLRFPLISKNFQTPWNIFPISPLQKILFDFRLTKFLMTFLVIDSNFLILPYFRCLSTFPPWFRKIYLIFTYFVFFVFP